MKISKILKLSFNLFIHSRLRSWLTIIGIFIGVAAVVAIISIAQGLQQNVSSQIQGLGQDTITISAGSSRAFGPREFGSGGAGADTKQLSDKDIQTLKLVQGIKYINGVLSGRASAKYQSATASLSIQGNDPAVFKEFITTDLASGRYLSQGDVKSIVIGNGVANNVFKTKLQLGSLLTINDKPFRIVGILESSSGGFGGSDNDIYMSVKDAREVLSSTSTLESDEYSAIVVKVSDTNYIQQVSDAISAALRNSHHVIEGKEDFSLTSALSIQQTVSTLLSTVTLFLGTIAAISLLVGGIGVANTMFTSVLEKTKDIGIMKAVGAKNLDIMLIFLFNSGLLGLVGGILGIMGGSAVSFVLPMLGSSSSNFGSGEFQTAITPELLILALAFSLAIGMISGAIPAYKASKLKPVDALRYE